MVKTEDHFVARGEETEREIPYMKGYTVFNAEQCDGLPAHYTTRRSPLPSPRCSALKRRISCSSWPRCGERNVHPYRKNERR
jgi:antirestriction protein ArdC